MCATDKDLGFQANIAYDFARRRSKVVPYVIGGGGAKIYLNDRWFVAPEARLGLETIARVTVSLGYSWR